MRPRLALARAPPPPVRPRPAPGGACSEDCCLPEGGAAQKDGAR